MTVLSEIFLFILITFGQFQAVRFAQGATLYLHDLAAIILFVYVLLDPGRRKAAIAAPLTKPILIFLAVLLLSLLVNAYRVTGAEFLLSGAYTARLIVYAGLYWYAVTSKRGNALIMGLFVCGTAISALGLVQLFLYPDLRNLYYLGWDPHFYRVFSTFLDPNFTGLFCILTGFLGLYLTGTQPKNRLLTVSLGINAAALLFTYSRSSYLAIISGLLSYAVLTGKYRMLMAALCILLVFWWIPKPDIVGFDLARSVTAISRIGNLREGYDLFTRSPVFGYGFNTLRYTVRQSEGVPDIVSHAQAGLDNSLMFILVTSGLVGLSAFLYLLCRILNLFRDANDRGVKVYFLSAAAAWFIHGQFVNSLFYPFFLVWIFIVAGSASSADQVSEGKHVKRKHT